MEDLSSIIIAPSILAGNFACLGEDAARAEKAGADWLHVDIMDGHFVPNISFGPEMTRALGRSTRLPLDVHLMISRPDFYAERFIEAGAFRITTHVEADHHVSNTLQYLKARKVRGGIALNPATSMEKVLPYLGEIDLLLIMTVNPGFGGQAFMSEVVDKIRRAEGIRKEKGLSFHIEVDGGINDSTAKICAEAGANVMVAGTSLFKEQDLGNAIRRMRETCRSVSKAGIK